MEAPLRGLLIAPLRSAAVLFAKTGCRVRVVLSASRLLNGGGALVEES